MRPDHHFRIGYAAAQNVATPVDRFVLAVDAMALLEKAPGKPERPAAYARRSMAEQVLAELHERRQFLDAEVVEVSP